jgi:lipopolysaccharide export system permease protein
MNISMALLAIFAVLGGDFSRRGYAKRIAVASGAALMLLLAAFAATSAAGDDPDLNIVQYGLQLFVIGLVSIFYFLVPALKRRALLARTGRRRLRAA